MLKEGLVWKKGSSYDWERERLRESMLESENVRI